MSDHNSPSEQGFPPGGPQADGEPDPRPGDQQLLQNLQGALEEIRDIVFITTPEGEIAYLNGAFERVYGFSREEALGKTPRILKSGRHGSDYYEKVWKALRAGEVVQGEYVNRTKDGRLVLVSSTIRPTLDSTGEVTSFVAVQRDIGDNLETRQLRETLNTVMDPAVAELLLEKRLLTEKRRASVLLTGLADFSRFSGERRPEVTITELNRLLQEIEEILFQYHSHIDKHLGDGILAEFGVPIEYERHALLAVVAGLKMQERMSRGGFPWKMRVSISTGELIMGLLGHRRQTYTALGEVVDRAIRIDQSGRPGVVTVGPQAFEEVRRFVRACRRTVFLHSEHEDPQLVETISRGLADLDETPGNPDLLKQVGLELMGGGYLRSAHTHLREALELDPDDTRSKLAYAEIVLALNESADGNSEGPQEHLYLYEILGLVNPVLDPERIPPALSGRYLEEVEQSFAYPEEMILPGEAIDGSIGHSRMVGFLAYAIADGMGLGRESKLEVLKAGYFADLGKQAVSHHLLNRAGSLSEQEFESVTAHPRESVRMLREAGLGDPAVFEIILASHENFNGTGYPLRLAGEEIPLSARILALADTYSGLTSWRPYRARWERGAAFAEIHRETERGRFDPAVVEALERLLSR